MKNSSRQTRRFLLLICIAFPAALLLLFDFLKSDSILMQTIFTNFSFPLRNFLARITSVTPLPIGEILAILLPAFFIFYIVRGIISVHKNSSGPLLAIKRVFNVFALGLWLCAGFFWLWNIGYYIPGFAEANQLARSAITTEDLEATTRYFAKITNQYANQVRRDENGLFAEEPDKYFENSIYIYDNFEKIFPSLLHESYIPKRLIFSRLQSNMGFTGFFCPYTGEANINVDAPACLQPVTIAHEIAHQRSVTPEDEANFVAIAACLSSDDPVYMYSGALMGLMKLGTVLNETSPESWTSITQTLEASVAMDWNNNAAYWIQIKTPLEEVSKDVYDSFLKSNGQELGIKSYGACIDLLVTYYSADAHENR